MRASVLVLALALSAGGCGPGVDLTTGLEIVDLQTGWYDAGVVGDGMNKLVPSATFRLKNVSDRALPVLQVNSLFRRENAPTEEWGSAFLTVTGSEGLAAGATTDPILVKSQTGYTGTESRAEMLQNKEFADAKVEIFAKYSSTQWQRLGEYPIERTLAAR